MPERVRITEVGPRDGLQNEPGIIPTEEKVRLVELCCATGVDEVEVTSFVSPKWVPQLGDAAEVCIGLARRVVKVPSLRDTRLSALVPNLKATEALDQVQRDSMQCSFEAGEEFPDGIIDKVALFTAASETFSQRNTNATIAETIQRFREVMKVLTFPYFGIRGYVSCAIACPFEGTIAPARVADVAAMLVDVGVTEIDLGDTIGAGTPDTVDRMLEAVERRIGWRTDFKTTLHLHDTFGRAAECVKAALDLGIRSFDGSVAGLGGCPYASTPGKRAPGNISTETLVRTVHDAGYETGVDLDKLAAAADYARSIVTKSRAGAGSGGVA